MLTFLLLCVFLVSILGALFFSFDFKEEEVQKGYGMTEKETKWNGFKYNPLSIGLAVFSLLPLAGAMGNVTVPPGDNGVLLRFGHPIRQLEPGLHFVRPIGDEVSNVTFQTRIATPNEDAGTDDLQIVHFQVTFRYHSDPHQAILVLQQYNNDLETKVINPVILEAIKATASRYNAEALLHKREEVRNSIEEKIVKALQGTPVVPEATAITDFRFSQDYEKAIEEKQVAQQNAEKARNVLEQTKVEAEQAKAQAEGTASAKVAQANGEAQAILAVAKAKAEAQKLQRQDLTPELLQLRTIEVWDKHWDGSVPSTYFGGTGKQGMFLNLPVPPAPSKKTVDKEDENQ